MKRVLLAVDGSEHALAAARALALFSPAEECIVLHAVQVPSMPYYTLFDPTLSARIDDRLRHDGEALVHHIASIIAPDTGKIRTRILTGDAANIVLSTAEEEHVDLIVTGARGTGPIEELVFGSVSHRVVTHARCPTLMVKRPVRYLRRAFLAVEGSDDAETAVRFLETKPFQGHVRVTVFTCPPINRPEWPVEIVSMEPHVRDAVASAKVFVDGIASQLVGLGYEAQGLVTVGIPALMITQHAVETDADVILMGSHGRRGLTRFLMGSVAHAVLHRSACSVVIIRLGDTSAHS